MLDDVIGKKATVIVQKGMDDISAKGILVTDETDTKSLQGHQVYDICWGGSRGAYLIGNTTRRLYLLLGKEFRPATFFVTDEVLESKFGMDISGDLIECDLKEGW